MTEVSVEVERNRGAWCVIGGPAPEACGTSPGITQHKGGALGNCSPPEDCDSIPQGSPPGKLVAFGAPYPTTAAGGLTRVRGVCRLGDPQLTRRR
jgi:hypothetical protein